MGKQTQVPDAWDDDWETQADQAAEVKRQQAHVPEPALSKSERLAQHVESNRKLWQSADAPETFHYLEASSSVPQATTNFKPQVKVLSRKPVLAKRDPATGLSLDDEAGEGSKKETQLTPEEIRAKQKRDRDEKQRRYEEARAKIFGESAPSSGASSPGTTTPPRSEGRQPQGRGRGRGGGFRNSDNRQFDNRRNHSGFGRELYDPNSSPKPDSLAAQRRGGDVDFQGRGPSPREDQQQQAIRAPRGPDGSGRGGFGFAHRGGKES